LIAPVAVSPNEAKGVNAMDEKTSQVMHECSRGSLDGSMVFPDVVAKLTAVGCEQYHADFRRHEKTYYMPDGRNHVEALPVGSRSIAQAFSPHSVVAALRTVQAGQISYVEFLKRIMEAGCAGYFVNIPGKRTIYLGRNGDLYVEYFPATSD
jgi:uncharacterized protein YbcV (DUF1398 family)